MRIIAYSPRNFALAVLAAAAAIACVTTSLPDDSRIARLGTPGSMTGSSQASGAGTPSTSGGGVAGAAAASGGGAEPSGGATGGLAGEGGTDSEGEEPGGASFDAGTGDGEGGEGGSGEGGSGEGGDGGTGQAGESSVAGAGGASTAGSSGAPSSDDFFGESRCTGDFDLCEDFESGSLDTNRWATRGPVPVIDDTRAARGSYSAHFHTEDNGLSLITQVETFPATGNAYYARVFAWFDAMPTAPAWAHWTISGAEGSGNDSEIRVGGQWDGSFNRFGVGTDYGPTGDWTTLDRDPDDSPAAVPEKQWVCIEWRLDATAHEIRFWWDDVEHPSLHVTRDDHGGADVPFELPAFESAWFGWWLYQPDTVPAEFDVWLDEIVVDDEPIGCSR